MKNKKCYGTNFKTRIGMKILMMKEIFSIDYCLSINKFKIILELCNFIYNFKLKLKKVSKMIPSRGFLYKFFCSLMEACLPIIENVLTSLGESVLIPLALTPAESPVHERIHKKYPRIWIGNNNIGIFKDKKEVIRIILKSF